MTLPEGVPGGFHPISVSADTLFPPLEEAVFHSRVLLYALLNTGMRLGESGKWVSEE